MRSMAAGLMVLASLSAADAAEVCKFVSVEDPKFTISFDGINPISTSDGVVTRYESMSGGTGIASRGAIDPDNPDIAYTYATHEFDGRTFLVFGPDLLVEKCAKAK